MFEEIVMLVLWLNIWFGKSCLLFLIVLKFEEVKRVLGFSEDILVD